MMTRFSPLLLAVFATTPAFADETRQLGAHEHGVGHLNIAFDGTQIAIELEAPGADIVGFEHAAESAEDRAAVEDAVARLARPLDLFIMPEAAACSVVQANAELESEAAHDEHAHDDQAHDEHDHAAKATHSEFHAEYLLTCADPSAAASITFAYFDAFPNALELEVQVVTEQGATAFEVGRDAPTLDLRNMF